MELILRPGLSVLAYAAEDAKDANFFYGVAFRFSLKPKHNRYRDKRTGRFTRSPVNKEVTVEHR